MKPINFVALFLIFCILPGCSPTPPADQAKIIRDALTRLLTRPKGSFVVFENPKTGKFVQFSGSKEEPLMLDLPIYGLSKDEMARAVQVFKKYGKSKPETYQVQESPGGQSAGEMSSFQVNMEKNTDKATDLTVEILHKVFKLKKNSKLVQKEE